MKSAQASGNSEFVPIDKLAIVELVKSQLSYIVRDMKEERQQSRSRGFHI